MQGTSPLSPAQSHYVLSRLIEDKKITTRDIVGYLGSMQSEIRALETRLQHLRTLAGSTAAKPAVRRRRRRRIRTAKPAAKPATTSTPAKKKVVLSPQQRTSRQLQGVYMSLIRQIPKTKRAAYQKLAKEKGRQAAVDQVKADLARKK